MSEVSTSSYGGRLVDTVGTAITVLLAITTDIEIADKDLDSNILLENPSVPKSFINNNKIESTKLIDEIDLLTKMKKKLRYNITYIYLDLKNISEEYNTNTRGI